ncbi:hypothetical protein Taro_032619 [Colocasia esculenta]|uniref:Peroxidase n=1 Tax=Colocasia esculenta TaxID=4460 RepID=A0A843W6M7_COLES|nr:hypothetical protein [Colocasia esculenta]
MAKCKEWQLFEPSFLCGGFLRVWRLPASVAASGPSCALIMTSIGSPYMLNPHPTVASPRRRGLTLNSILIYTQKLASQESNMEVSLCSVLPLFMLLLVSTADGGLSATFYERSCPKLEAIVRKSMREIVRKEPRMAASILRLSFHDCFVNGCDASVLLADTPTFTGEQNAKRNRNSIRGMDKIEEVKTNVEAACSGMVSCADILALAARDAVVLAGGPSWTVLLGRRDARMANQTAANINIPSPALSLGILTSRFSAKGLSQRDLVALSGVHTIGFTRNGSVTLLQLDVQTADIFDNAYYQNLVAQRGVLRSDQELFGDDTDRSTKSIVERYIGNESLFFRDFAAAMVSMGNISPLTGTGGEIRKNCSKLN